LKGIARNLCFNYFRRNSRRNRLQREALLELLLKAESDELQITAEGPVRSALDICYETLPADSRRMLKLKYEQEMPSQDIAEKLQSTAEAIRVALFRIRHALRECITRSLAAEQLL
jgi:RNA polymerase sigma factor (sigma-70 family)